MAFLATLTIDPNVGEALVPAIVFATMLGVVVAISVAVACVKIRHREVERDILARRMAHDQRMKELEIEALRLQQNANRALVEN